jgi:ABC-type uncharacterized transport system substrate-binding protein
MRVELGKARCRFHGGFRPAQKRRLVARIVETQRRRWRAPFEEPTHYKLVINLKIANATGIELPVNFLALADKVIE